MHLQTATNMTISVNLISDEHKLKPAVCSEPQQNTVVIQRVS